MASAPLSLARRMLFGQKTATEPGPADPVPARKRPFRVLSIDGGGIRGILPAMVLSDLERRTGRPIIDLFDMIVGTSSGGLIALGLSCPGEGGKPRHTARDVLRLYEVEGKRVFSRSVWHKIRAVGNLADEKYPASGVEGVLEDYFGEARLKDALCDVVVPAYEAGDPRRDGGAHLLRAGTDSDRRAQRLLRVGRWGLVCIQSRHVRLHGGAAPFPQSRLGSDGFARHRRADAAAAV
jgi:hypothetical protein